MNSFKRSLYKILVGLATVLPKLRFKLLALAIVAIGGVQGGKPGTTPINVHIDDDYGSIIQQSGIASGGLRKITGNFSENLDATDTTFDDSLNGRQSSRAVISENLESLYTEDASKVIACSVTIVDNAFTSTDLVEYSTPSEAEPLEYNNLNEDVGSVISDNVFVWNKQKHYQDNVVVDVREVQTATPLSYNNLNDVLNYNEEFKGLEVLGNVVFSDDSGSVFNDGLSAALPLRYSNEINDDIGACYSDIENNFDRILGNFAEDGNVLSDILDKELLSPAISKTLSETSTYDDLVQAVLKQRHYLDNVTYQLTDMSYQISKTLLDTLTYDDTVTKQLNTVGATPLSYDNLSDALNIQDSTPSITGEYDVNVVEDVNVYNDNVNCLFKYLCGLSDNNESNYSDIGAGLGLGNFNFADNNGLSYNEAFSGLSKHLSDITDNSGSIYAENFIARSPSYASFSDDVNKFVEAFPSLLTHRGSFTDAFNDLFNETGAKSLPSSGSTPLEYNNLSDDVGSTYQEVFSTLFKYFAQFTETNAYDDTNFVGRLPLFNAFSETNTYSEAFNALHKVNTILNEDINSTLNEGFSGLFTHKAQFSETNTYDDANFVGRLSLLGTFNETNTYDEVFNTLHKINVPITEDVNSTLNETFLSLFPYKAQFSETSTYNEAFNAFAPIYSIFADDNAPSYNETLSSLFKYFANLTDDTGSIYSETTAKSLPIVGGSTPLEYNNLSDNTALYNEILNARFNFKYTFGEDGSSNFNDTFIGALAFRHKTTITDTNAYTDAFNRAVTIPINVTDDDGARFSESFIGKQPIRSSSEISDDNSNSFSEAFLARENIRSNFSDTSQFDESFRGNLNILCLPRSSNTFDDTAIYNSIGLFACNIFDTSIDLFSENLNAIETLSADIREIATFDDTISSLYPLYQSTLSDVYSPSDTLQFNETGTTGDAYVYIETLFKQPHIHATISSAFITVDIKTAYVEFKLLYG